MTEKETRPQGKGRATKPFAGSFGSHSSVHGRQPGRLYAFALRNGLQGTFMPCPACQPNPEDLIRHGPAAALVTTNRPQDAEIWACVLCGSHGTAAFAERLLAEAGSEVVRV